MGIKGYKGYPWVYKGVHGYIMVHTGYAIQYILEFKYTTI